MNQLAHQVVAESIGEAEKTPTPKRSPGRRVGGLKGDRARRQFTPEERSEIVHKAAAARWKPEPEVYARQRRKPEDDD